MRRLAPVGITIMIFVISITGCAGNIKNGTAFLKEEKYEQAIEAFEKDIDRERNLDEAYRGKGIGHFELDEYEKAAESFELAIENEAEKSATLCSLLGACYMEMEEYEKALDAYENALADEEITAKLKQEIQYNLIAVYEYMGNWEAAKKQVENYVENYPDDTRVDKEAEFLETR